MFQAKFEEKIKTHFFLYSMNFFPEIMPFMRQCKKILHRQASHRWQYDACALHAGYIRLQKHTPNM